jgi:FMN-dependent NADH-azoreductase
MNNIPLEISLEIEKVNREIESMSPTQLKEFAKKLFQHHKSQEVLYKDLIAKNWNIDNS